MEFPRSCQVHPTALVSPETELAERVTIGPYAILEGKVQIGPECVIKAHAQISHAILGRGNVVFPGAMLGEQPQHQKYNNEPTRVEIGDYNIFRENVTVHRGTTQSWVTRIGSHNYFMAGSHVAHDCQLGSHCMLANNALLGGHCLVADYVFISGNAAVHQFVSIGRMAMLSGVSAASKDIPPFVIQRDYNTVVGVNVIGMRRAGMPPSEINAIRRAYHILFRGEQMLPTSLAKAEAELGDSPAVRELVQFCREAPRGVSLSRARRRDQAA